MSLSRKHFTALAEYAGDVASGVIGPDQAIEQMIAHLRGTGTVGNLDPDKFTAHAESQRRRGQGEAQHLLPGDVFVKDGSAFIIKKITSMPNRISITASVPSSREGEVTFDFGRDEVV